VEAVELELSTRGERGFDLARFGAGDGPVELYDRRAGEARELAVQGRDLRPVPTLVDVQGCDRCHVGPDEGAWPPSVPVATTCSGAWGIFGDRGHNEARIGSTSSSPPREGSAS
jgi:hypothetical protein